MPIEVKPSRAANMRGKREDKDHENAPKWPCRHCGSRLKYGLDPYHGDYIEVWCTNCGQEYLENGGGTRGLRLDG